VTLTQCIVGRFRAHTVVTEEKAPRRPSWLWGGGERGGGGDDRQLSVLVSYSGCAGVGGGEGGFI
jgi:hypothetical protein